MTSPIITVPDAETLVLRPALEAERGRTTLLRRELDEARIALSRSKGEIEALERHRDIWADRSSQLRGTLKDVREGLRAAETERDALRARLEIHDADLETIRLHRDIWAERARALATALCQDPVPERRDPVSMEPVRPARKRPSLVKAAI